MADNNAFNLFQAINIVRQDIAEGKVYSDADMQYILTAYNNFVNMCNEMGLFLDIQIDA